MSNVPKLRFKEFSGEWEEKYLKEIAHINPKTNHLPNQFIYIDLESVEKGLLVKSNKIQKDEAPSRAQRLLSFNDILFQTVRPYQKNNYLFKLIGDYVASTGYAQIRAHESSEFLYQKLHTENFVNKVLLRCTGTSYPAINSTDLANIKIYTTSKPEQEKIALFLSAIDTKVEQLTQKQSLLEQYKKGVMQKIFSQEIRFKADDGSEFPEWEEKKLSLLCSIKKGSQLNKDNLTEIGDYPAINGGINPSGYTTEYNTEKNTITISEGGNSCGYVNFMTTKFWSGGHNYSLQDLKKNIENQYLFQYLKNNENVIMSLRVGSGLPNIQKSEISNFKISVPCLKEQTKIANFLSAIDKKIELNKTKIVQAKEFKKGLLQQMFV